MTTRSRRKAGGDGAAQVAEPTEQSPLPNFSGSNAGPDEASLPPSTIKRSPHPAPTLAESEDDGGGHYPCATQGVTASPVKIRRKPLRLPEMPTAEIIGRLVEEGRRWNDVVRAHQRLVLQAKAISRRSVTHETGKLDERGLKRIRDDGATLYASIVDGSTDNLDAALVIAPFLHAMAVFAEQRKDIERTIKALARKLPVWGEWGAAVYGLSDLWFGLLIGEAGDIARFSTPAKLWKRMGLAVIGGERQRKRSDPAEAELHGYTPRRRALMWNVGSSLIGGVGHGPRPLVGEDISARDDWSPYQRLFVERLRYEAAKNPAHARPATEKGKESFSLHASNRAKRYVEKRLLRDLWRAWRRLPEWQDDPTIEFRAAA